MPCVEDERNTSFVKENRKRPYLLVAEPVIQDGCRKPIFPSERATHSKRAGRADDDGTSGRESQLQLPGEQWLIFNE